MDPTLAGFASFIAGVMGITTSQLPASSPVIPFAFNMATNLVNQSLQSVGNANTSLPSIYAVAVYNLAGDRLVNYAQDQPGQTFFADARKNFGLNSFVGGVISSTSDEGTSESLVVPDFMRSLTFSDLNTLKTPWGRAYLALAQDFGTIWGLS